MGMMKIKVFLSAVMLLSGILCLTVRNRPNRFVGVRFGYTLESQEAWRKANSLVGVYSTALGLIFLTLSLFGLSILAFLAIYFTSLAVLIYVSFRVAKETYELEDLKTPMEEDVKPVKLEVDLGRALVFELVSMVAYAVVAVALWNSIPVRMAVHFSLSGPDFYTEKTFGVILPLVVMGSLILLTLLLKREPLLLRKRAERALVATQFLVASLSVVVLLFNVHLVTSNVVVGIAVIGILAVILVVLS